MPHRLKYPYRPSGRRSSGRAAVTKQNPAWLKYLGSNPTIDPNPTRTEEVVAELFSPERRAALWAALEHPSFAASLEWMREHQPRTATEADERDEVPSFVPPIVAGRFDTPDGPVYGVQFTQSGLEGFLDELEIAGSLDDYGPSIGHLIRQLRALRH